MQPLGGFLAGGGVITTFVVFIIFVPVIDKVHYTRQQIGKVDETVCNRDPLAVNKLLCFLVAAFALQTKKLLRPETSFP